MTLPYQTFSRFFGKPEFGFIYFETSEEYLMHAVQGPLAFQTRISKIEKGDFLDMQDFERNIKPNVEVLFIDTPKGGIQVFVPDKITKPQP